MADNRLIPCRGHGSGFRPHAFDSCAEPATGLRSNSYRTKLESGLMPSSEALLASKSDAAGLCGMRGKQVVGQSEGV